jgi:hypothetical protein
VAYFALYRRAVERSVSVPVIDSLQMIPLISDQFLGGVKNLGVITEDSSLLTSDLIERAGHLGNRSVTVVGLQNEPTFREQILDGLDTVDADLVAAAVSNAAKLAHEADRPSGRSCSSRPPFPRTRTLFRSPQDSRFMISPKPSVTSTARHIKSSIAATTSTSSRK